MSQLVACCLMLEARFARRLMLEARFARRLTLVACCLLLVACKPGPSGPGLFSRCAGRGERPYLQFTFGVPLRTHPGIVFKLTANPTDTGSILPCTVANGSGISPSHNPIPKRFDQQGTNIFLFYHKFFFNNILQIVAPMLDAIF
jgi:hypothetical protein